MKTVDIYFSLRKSYKNKNGEHPINICVKIADKHHCPYSTKIMVSPENWDEYKEEVKQSDAEHFTKNQVLQDIKKDYQRTTLKLNLDGILCYDVLKKEIETLGKVKDIEEFEKLKEEKLIDIPETNKHDFFVYTRKYIDIHKCKWSEEYLKDWTTFFSKLQKFQGKIFIEDINIELAEKIEHWMRSDRENLGSTVHKNFKKIKQILIDAVEKEIIPKNKLKKYTIKKNPPNRKALHRDFVKILIKFRSKNLKTLPPTYLEVLTYFLFSCFTGLRYKDIRSLKWREITHDNILKKVIHKGKKPIIVPIIKECISLLPTRKNPDDFVFNTISNAKTNQYLKAIFVMAKIDKPDISMHVARHTFGSTSVNLDVNIVALQNMMGHSKIETTMRYLTMDEEKPKIEMSKWENDFSGTNKRVKNEKALLMPIK